MEVPEDADGYLHEVFQQLELWSNGRRHIGVLVFD